ncbi:MAG: DUF5655 domain-containing protein [Lawsonibacter sp.]|jgi:hypothetical protein
MNTPEFYEGDLLRFFDGKPVELALYQRLFDQLDQAFPQASVKVQKSQISFYGRHLFAAASLPIRRKKDWPDTCLLVTFGLFRRLYHPRIAVTVEPYPNRWTHHILLTKEEEIDRQLLNWLDEAYQCSQQKR